MAAMYGEVANLLVDSFNTRQPRFAIRQIFHTLRIRRVSVMISQCDKWLECSRSPRRSDVLSIVEDRAIGRHETGLEAFGRAAEGNETIGNFLGERSGFRTLACH